MEGLQIPNIDFTASAKKKRKVAASSAERPPEEVVVVQASGSPPQDLIPRRQSDRRKGKAVAKPAAKSATKSAAKSSAEGKEEEIFCPVFHNYKLKRSVLITNSLKDDPSFGMALLSGVCLPRDVEEMPKSRNALISRLASQIAATAQTAAVCFEKIAEVDDRRETRLAELDAEHKQVQDGLKEKIAQAKALFQKESEDKARAEANCADALKSLDEARRELAEYKARAEANCADALKSLDEARRELAKYKAGEKMRLQGCGKSVMQATIDQLQRNVDEAMDKWRQEGMEQGFELGCRWGLESAQVPKDSPFWVFPPIPAYVAPDAEVSHVEAEGGEEDAGGSVSSKAGPSGEPDKSAADPKDGAVV